MLAKKEISVQEFEIFKGNVKHSVKYDGQEKFIRQILLSNEIERFWNDGLCLYSLYLLAMVDYLSKLNQIPLYNKYEYLRHYKMDEKIYPMSLIVFSELEKVDKDELASDAIPEFLKYNIVEGDIFNVV